MLAAMASAPDGLMPDDAAARFARFGPNRIVVSPPESAWRILARQFASIVVALLVAAALFAFATGQRADAIAIAAVLALNILLGFATELRARQAMLALLALRVTRATVIRGRARYDIDAEFVVPGDVIVLEIGTAVPADARLLHATELQVVEAPLTGESTPVAKRAGPPAAVHASLPERATMVYGGTIITRGAGRAVVVSTGMATQVGRVGTLTQGIGSQRTPLELRLDTLGRQLALVAVAAALIVGAIEWWQGLALAALIPTVIAVTIAAVPEGLPAVVTIAMAAGVRRMARRHALVRHLATVESIGETTVVCTDKTGTLTVGQMTATALVAGGVEYTVTGVGYAPHGDVRRDNTVVTARSDRALATLLRIGVLANRADVQCEDGQWVARGDPTDAALLVAAAKAGIDRAAVAASWPEVAQLSFSSERMLMATINRAAGPADGPATQVAFVKGAPARVLARCTLSDAKRARLAEDNLALASRGLRVLAFAERAIGDGVAFGTVAAIDHALHDLTFIGFVGLTDPPAARVEQTIARLRAAGIRTLMLTGDQRATAEAVAKRLGLLDRDGVALDGAEVDAMSDDALGARIGDARAISRVSPEGKLRVVRALQARGDIVTMLGDGVNDAPALRAADVGVALGGRGTDVAKEAADVVLEDDRFETVSVAVEEGRAIFDNVGRFVFYLLACNLAEIATLAAGGLAGAVAPLAPLQILWLNLATDTTPALALALEPAARGAMARPPRRPGTPILSRRLFGIAIALSILITIVTLVAWRAGAHDWVRSGAPATDATARGRSYAFMTLAFAQLWVVGVARTQRRADRAVTGAPLGRGWARNPWALLAVAGTTAAQAATAFVPPLARILHIVPLGVRDWLLIVAAGIAPAVIASAVRRLLRWRAL